MTDLLNICGLQGWYGESHVLHGINVTVRPGETVALIGRNGAGKTTTLRALMNLLDKREGAIVMDGQDLINLPRHRVAAQGLGYVPEERGIFTTLSVAENLRLLPRTGEGMSDAQIFEFFPNLQERLASDGGKLSGGEQQMLAIARVLRTGPRLLLLDEPTEGLAPVIVQRIGHLLRALKAQGLAMLLVEQNLAFARGLADRFYLIENGRIAGSFANDEFEANAERVAAIVGV
nr:ABC transporter ATP-binding protein [Paracoccus saliphilus]